MFDGLLATTNVTTNTTTTTTTSNVEYIGDIDIRGCARFYGVYDDDANDAELIRRINKHLESIATLPPNQRKCKECNEGKQMVCDKCGEWRKWCSDDDWEGCEVCGW
jgi:hypothetical protein